MNALLDSSFLIDLLNELAAGTPGPACAWLERNKRARCFWISAVSAAEVLEGAADIDTVRAFLGRFRWQGLHQAHAVRVALLQSRSKQRLA
jgi:predicted nucleic acid-binding protein